MLTDELDSVFDESIVAARRAYNMRHSLQHRLPNELWCLIWAYLPSDSVLSISRVCHSWRLLALACPRLWCRLGFWSMAHAEGCDCRECKQGYVGTCNIDETLALLPRSRALPLNLDIWIEAPSAYFDVMEVLADALSPHSQRIAAMELRADSYDVADFFSRFDALPMLRSLVVKFVKGQYCLSSSPLVPSDDNTGKTLLLPSLERMATPCGIGTLPLFPATLTSLSCPFFGVDDVIAYLDQVPNLQRLELVLSRFFWGLDGADDFARLKRACIRVPSVTLHEIPRSDARDLMVLLGTEYRELRFSYESTFRDRDAGLQILNTIREPAWLSICEPPWSRNEDRIEIAAGDAASRVRSVAFYAGEQRELVVRWQATLTRQLPDVLVDLELLSWVAPTLAAGITALIVNIPFTDIDIDCPPSLPKGTPVFSALKTIEFRLLLGPPRYAFGGGMLTHCAPTDEEVEEIRCIAQELFPQTEREMATNVSVMEDNGIWTVYIDRSVVS